MEKKATRESYGAALAELGEKYDFVVLDADLAEATKTGVFKKKFPERFFDCGIAEGNMMCVAAGIASTGKPVFASTFAIFASGRAHEQVRNEIMTRSSQASQVPDYEKSKANIAGYWFILCLHAFVYALLSIIFLEFIDKDKR